MTNNEAIISKIRKVLALAAQPGTSAEGEAAMLLAQRMMAKNKIDAADIKTQAPIQKEVVDEVGSRTTRSVWWHGNLAEIIAANFRCYVYIQKERSTGTTSIKFLGLKDDVELAREVFKYAIDMIDYTSKKYAQEHRNLGSLAGIKNQFILGFIAGIKAKFDEQVKHNDWGLIIVKDALVTQAQAKLHLRSANHSRVRITFNDTARNDGYNQGKNFTPCAGSITGN